MSLVWPSREADVVVGEPRLHAFVIGVAEYPHLLGGTGPLAEEPLGLSQISTARHTAEAIAGWLLSSYQNAACPLGSVELLISPAGTLTLPRAGAVDVESATKSRVKASFKRWVARCSAQKDNIAFFYFCGHGLQTSTQALLLEDFGNPDEANVWENSIDFDGTRLGMRRCKADTQLFFVDACREAPIDVLAHLKVAAESLMTATYYDSVACVAVYNAAAPTQKAHGLPDRPTFFAQAVISCLNGVAALGLRNRWAVDTATLSSGLAHVMRLFARRHGLPLVSNHDVSGIGHIHEASSPKVMASVGCSSEAANRAAEITLHKDGRVIKSEVGEPKPILEEVDAGIWTIDVRFPEGEFAVGAPQEHRFDPPIFEGVDVP